MPASMAESVPSERYKRIAQAVINGDMEVAHTEARMLQEVHGLSINRVMSRLHRKGAIGRRVYAAIREHRDQGRTAEAATLLVRLHSLTPEVPHDAVPRPRGR